MQRQTSRHPLDRPVWSALESRQATLCVGNHLARRFAPGFGPFAAARDERPEALEALEELIAPCERLKPTRALFREGRSPSAARRGFKWCLRHSNPRTGAR